jgi:K+-transporting ATPase ATPase A chain
MTLKAIGEIGFFFAIIYLIARPMGIYLHKIFSGQKTILSCVLGWLEDLLYKIGGVKKDQEQLWFEYALSLLVFNLLGIIFLLIITLLQNILPLNPQKFGSINIPLALNTAVSFVTNTNWQAYVPETTMTYLIQMVGLAVQNFLSAATGMCVAMALIRGFVKRESATIGNFWVDLIRGTIYILLPIAVIGAAVLIWQGVPQNFSAYQSVSTLEGREQIIAQGPIASQESIKMLGTNGGGFLNANSSHPYENPTPLTNLIEMLLMITLPAGLIFAFGFYAGDARQGRALFNAVFLIMLISSLIALYSEHKVNPLIKNEFKKELLINNNNGNISGNMEGKETRFGIGQSVIFSVTTTSISCGAVNNMHDSNMPLTGLIEMFNMQLGELIFGGIGSGLYFLLLFGILTVFIAGLMIGRTPEYLGKKIGPKEMQLTVVAVLLPSALILIFTALVVFIPSAIRSVSNLGPHGFSQLLYAYTSASQNNGSAFAGLNANTPFWNLTLALCMLLGRFVPLVLVLKLASNLAVKKITPSSPGTLPTNNIFFSILLIMIIIIVGGLTFFPALAIGPLVEHLLIINGIGF